MYVYSKITGKIYRNDIEIIADDRLDDWMVYVKWLALGNSPAESDGTADELQFLETEKAKNNEFNLYQKRQQDGVDAYLRLSAEFRLAKLNGIITEEEQKGIERILIPVRNEVLAGQWISALQILEEISFTNIGESLYNRLHLLLTNYIALNYTT